MRRVPSINEGVVVRQIGTPLTHARFLRRQHLHVRRVCIQ